MGSVVVMRLSTLVLVVGWASRHRVTDSLLFVMWLTLTRNISALAFLVRFEALALMNIRLLGDLLLLCI